MDAALERLVWRRARGCCGIPRELDELPFEIDHIISEQHGGRTVASNLALSCFFCNRHKGPNLAGIDPATRRHTKLFHPRRHSWKRHFQWNGPVLAGRTAVGRTTIRMLKINDQLRIWLREELIAEAEFPVPEREV